jgi:ubiquinone/menaquinone biosynthesis C-methylase UbiE
MPSNFENAATFYDKLSQLVYGKALLKAQGHFLSYIKPGSHILIAGGGTGKIIEQITAQHAHTLTIVYVELSESMMALSRKRAHGNNKVIFINKPVESVVFDMKFDVIITSFFFINFKQENLEGHFNHIHHFAKPGALWLNTDFQYTGRWWQWLLLKSMFWFFKVVCNIETTTLPNTAESFYRHDYHPINEKDFFGSFIKTTVYTAPL